MEPKKTTARKLRPLPISPTYILYRNAKRACWTPNKTTTKKVVPLPIYSLYEKGVSQDAEIREY